MNSEQVSKISGAVESTEGLPIRYDLYHPAKFVPSDTPIILFLHGFKGFKDWGTFPLICKRLSKGGFVVVAVNFSLNGIGENPLQFDRLDLFSRETLSQDLDDVGSVLNAIKRGEITAGGTHLNSINIGILGHSRGGQTAIAAAAEYDEIECLITWSAVADYNARWSDAMKNEWETRGVTEIKNGRTGQIMPIKRVVYDDARENSSRLIALGSWKFRHYLFTPLMMKLFPLPMPDNYMRRAAHPKKNCYGWKIQAIPLGECILLSRTIFRLRCNRRLQRAGTGLQNI
jgi:pimeloyl-ACP methyl ester carboxylesterase